MIWDSTLWMTLFDVALIGVAVGAILVLRRSRQHDSSGARSAVGGALIVAGISVLGAFHLADLVLMLAAPHWLGRSAALRLMTGLHLNLNWIANLTGASAIFAGFVLSERAALTARARLREAEARFLSYLEHSHDILTVLDEKRRVAYHSPAFRRFLGYPPEERFGHIPTELTHPADVAALRTAVGEAFAHPGQLLRATVRMRHADGTWRYLESVGSVHHLPGIGERLIINSRDVTERRRAEEERAASERRFREMFHNMPVSLWEEDFSAIKAYLNALDLTGVEDFGAYLHDHPEVVLECADLVRVKAVNRESARLLEAKDEPRLLEDIASTFTEESFEVFRRELVAIWRGDTELAYDTRVRTFKGENRDVHLHWAVSPGHEETLESVLVSLTDFTESKRAEREVEELNRTLERRVEERTGELAAAVEELKAFTYSVSHDLKAPLRAIDGFSRILEEDHAGALDSEGRRVLGVVRRSARRMGLLIDDLLVFSRLGQREIVRSTVDAGALVRSVFEERASGELQRAIRLEVGELPPMHGDPTMMRQLFDNLIGNAIKFTAPREEAVIEVSGREEKDGSEVIFSVRDNGVGFDPEYAGKLFAVFERLHHADEFPGTGVGLAIVRRIVERHGGRVWAEGELDRGAKVSFALPRERESAP